LCLEPPGIEEPLANRLAVVYDATRSVKGLGNSAP
jgi:hypothetical protein